MDAWFPIAYSLTGMLATGDPLALDVRPIPLLADNYAYLLRDEATGTLAALDPSAAPAVERALAESGWSGGLALILCTHHHWDHVGGNLELQAKHGCDVVCSAHDLARVPGATRGRLDGESVAVGESVLTAIAIPGHTLGHTAYYLAPKCDQPPALFSGDTLFAFGAGRLFEGTPEQLRASLGRIAHLPDDTRLYFGHEYAERNHAFARSLVVEGKADEALEARWARLRERLTAGLPGVPASLSEEKSTNPFFRVEDPAFRERIGLAHLDAQAAFTELRVRRDAW